MYVLYTCYRMLKRINVHGISSTGFPKTFNKDRTYFLLIFLNSYSVHLEKQS